MRFKNPRQINSEGWITCDIDHPSHGWMPYTLNPLERDPKAEFSNQELLKDILSSGQLEPYVPPTEAELIAQKSDKVRLKRNRMLRTVDRVVSNPLRWANFDDVTRQEIADYRQELLDVPQQAGFPDDVLWPVFDGEL